MKILLLNQFIHFINWPNDRLSTSEQFNIGFIGDSPLLTQRMYIHKKIRIPGKEIGILRVTEPNQIKECQILVIAASEAGRLNEIIAVTANRPILTISHAGGFCHRGVLINFFNIGSKIKFEINMEAIKKSGLDFSSKIFKMAKIIYAP